MPETVTDIENLLNLRADNKLELSPNVDEFICNAHDNFYNGYDDDRSMEKIREFFGSLKADSKATFSLTTYIDLFPKQKRSKILLYLTKYNKYIGYIIIKILKIKYLFKPNKDIYFP